MIINLIEQIEAVNCKINALQKEKKQKIEQIEKEYTEQIGKYKNALEVLTELNETCTRCDGRGFYRQLDASGNWEQEKCEVCKGTGRLNKVERDK